MFEGESSAKVLSGSELRVHHEFPWNSLVILVICDRLKVKCRNPSVHGFLWRWAIPSSGWSEKNLQIFHIARKGGKLSLIFADTSSLLYIGLYIYIHVYSHISHHIQFYPHFVYITPSNHEHVCFKTSSFLWLTKYYTTTTSWNLHKFPIKISHVPGMLLLCFAPFFPSLRRLRKSRLQPAQLLINDLPMANLPGMCSVRGPNRFHPAG